MVNVIASTNSGTIDRSGTIGVKTSSGITKNVSVSQEGNPLSRVVVTNGFKFRSSKSVAFRLSYFLYYKESQNGSPETVVLGNRPVTISGDQTYTVTTLPGGVQVKQGSIFIGFLFQFASYSGTFPSRISLTATTITLNSSSIQVSSISRTITAGDKIITSCSQRTLSDYNEIDMSNLFYQLF